MDDLDDNVSAHKILLITKELKKVWKLTKNEAPQYEGEIKVIDSSTHEYNNVYDNKGIIVVKDTDPFKVVATYSKNLKTLLVTPACTTNKGGGVEEGIQTQEAEICRRSNYRSALRKIEPKYYPLKPGTLIAAHQVNVFKGNAYKPLKEVFNTDIISIALPIRPSTIIENNRELYEREFDKNITRKAFNLVINIAKTENYKVIILNNLGMGVNKHPTDDFIDILSEFIASGIACIYILLPKGTKTGSGRDDRYLFCRYRKELSNRIDDPNSECDEPDEDDPETIEGRPQRREIIEQVDEDEYSSEDESDEEQIKVASE